MVDCDYLRSVASLDNPVLKRELAEFSSVEQVLCWAKKGNPSLEGLEVIQQDEFTFDLILPLDPARWIVFATS